MRLQSRMTVFLAIGAMLALMGGIVYYASLDNVSLESVEFLSGSVRVIDVNTVDERARIEVTFDVRNPSDTTFTIPGINYTLSVEGQEMVSGKYSTADVAMPGRVIFSTGKVIPLKSVTYMVKTESNEDLYNMLVAGQITNYDSAGIVVVESAWSIVERGFEVELEARS